MASSATSELALVAPLGVLRRARRSAPLPSEFARLLVGITHAGRTVVLAGESTAPGSVVHPAVLAPVDATTEEAEPDQRLG
jgi:hypothetical protein